MPSVLAVAFGALVLAVPAASELQVRSSRATTPPGSAFVPLNAYVGPRQSVFFGYVRSLVRQGGRMYRARIDPTLILTGVTATMAAVEDGLLRRGEPVPNDYYERNESRRPLTYRVPATAHVTVLVNPGTGPRSTVISVAELAQIVKGGNPKQRPGLWGPGSGFYVRVSSDRVLALDQAYRP
jgi:hypothetical protein